MISEENNTKIPQALLKRIIKERHDGMVGSDSLPVVEEAVNDFLDRLVGAASDLTFHRKGSIIKAKDIRLAKKYL